MIELILSGVRTPERPSSPENAFMTEEDIFAEKNPSVIELSVNFVLIFNFKLYFFILVFLRPFVHSGNKEDPLGLVQSRLRKQLVSARTTMELVHKRFETRKQMCLFFNRLKGKNK